ncbi:MAG: DUF3179 domain-containing (seleno)protein, partial [Thiotrichaceae bacterium]
MKGFRFTIALLLLTTSATLFSQPIKNGFDLKNSQIAAGNIHQGGPAKDGIASIDKPEFVTTTQATFLKENDRVLGVVRRGEARAYPIKILNWHEIVND